MDVFVVTFSINVMLYYRRSVQKMMVVVPRVEWTDDEVPAYFNYWLSTQPIEWAYWSCLFPSVIIFSMGVNHLHFIKCPFYQKKTNHFLWSQIKSFISSFWRFSLHILYPWHCSIASWCKLFLSLLLFPFQWHDQVWKLKCIRPAFAYLFYYRVLLFQ